MSPLKAAFAAIACVGFLANGPAWAEADGPDFFSVTGVAEGDVLNIRAAPSADGARLATIPADGVGIANLGCIGGLSLAEWEAATEAEREAGRKTRWCRVGYDRTIGWAAGWFLTEGANEDNFRAGGGLFTIAGSEWALRDFAGETPSAEAWIAFKADNVVTGNAGCNTFNGSYEMSVDAPVFSPFATTRMMCPEMQMETETRLLQALGQTRSLVTHHLVMAIFDGDGTLLATFARRDAD